MTRFLNRLNLLIAVAASVATLLAVAFVLATGTGHACCLLWGVASFIAWSFCD